MIVDTNNIPSEQTKNPVKIFSMVVIVTRCENVNHTNEQMIDPDPNGNWVNNIKMDLGIKAGILDDGNPSKDRKNLELDPRSKQDANVEP